MPLINNLKISYSRKEANRFNFIALAKVGLPSVTVYLLYNALFIGDLALTLILLLFVIELLISLFLIGKVREIRFILDLNTILFGSLLFYLLCTGGEGNSRALWMLFYPIVIFFLRDDKKTLAFNWITFAGIIIVFINPLDLNIHDYSPTFAIRYLTVFGCESTVLYWFQQYRIRYQTGLEEKNRDLQEALDKVHVLSGFIPICSSCKKIRDDQGYWSRLEQYVAENSDVEFSHGICPDCAKNIYPDLVEQIEKEGGLLPSGIEKKTKG